MVCARELLLCVCDGFALAVFAQICIWCAPCSLRALCLRALLRALGLLGACRNTKMLPNSIPLHDRLRPVFRTIAGVTLVVSVAEQLRHT